MEIQGPVPIYLMRNPKVSVIVPIYNLSNHIQSCVKSLLAQTFQDLEIILIDDGSTDDSMQKMQALVDNKSFIHIIHQENQGVAFSRNVGISHSKGEYLTFVDGDDTINPCYCQELYQTAKKNNSDIVIAKLKRKGDGWIIWRQNSIINEDELQNRKKRLKHCLNENISLFNCGKLFAKSLFIKNKFMPSRYYEDKILMPQLIVEANNINYNHQAEYTYYYRADSISNSLMTEKKMQDRLFAIQCNIDLARKYQFTEQEIESCLRYEFRWLRFKSYNYKKYRLAMHFKFYKLMFYYLKIGLLEQTKKIIAKLK